MAMIGIILVLIRSSEESNEEFGRRGREGGARSEGSGRRRGKRDEKEGRTINDKIMQNLKSEIIKFPDEVEMISVQNKEGSAAPTPAITYDDFSSRTIFSVDCQGTYNRQKYQNLDQVCKDCFNLYRSIKNNEDRCRDNCFQNNIFDSCVQGLNLPEDEYKSAVKELAGQKI